MKTKKVMIRILERFVGVFGYELKFTHMKDKRYAESMVSIIPIGIVIILGLLSNVEVDGLSIFLTLIILTQCAIIGSLSVISCTLTEKEAVQNQAALQD